GPEHERLGVDGPAQPRRGDLPPRREDIESLGEEGCVGEPHDSCATCQLGSGHSHSICICKIFVCSFWSSMRSSSSVTFSASVVALCVSMGERCGTLCARVPIRQIVCLDCCYKGG